MFRRDKNKEGAHNKLEYYHLVHIKDDSTVGVRVPDDGSEGYNEPDLQQFQKVVMQRLEDARNDLNLLLSALNRRRDDIYATFKLSDSGSDIFTVNELWILALRQKQAVEELIRARERITNKTYGRCQITGQLIPKQLLIAQPCATMVFYHNQNQVFLN